MNVQEIQKYLQDHKIYAEVWEQNDQVVVSIEWGDWKHDHLYCVHLMKEKGYDHTWERVTEEDGSDCYSAEHFFELKQNN
jgi:hypothetical protein